MSDFKIEITEYTVTGAEDIDLRIGIDSSVDNKLIKLCVEDGLSVWLTAEQAKQVAEHIVKLADVIGGE